MDIKSLDQKQIAELEEKLKKTKEKVEAFVHEYPLTSVAIAVGVGYLLGRLLSRGNHK